MDSLCFRTGLHGITPVISGRRNSPPVGADRTSSARFPFNYPTRSQFSGAKNRVGTKDVALDDAVLMDCKECKQGNGNWIEEEEEENSMGDSEQSDRQNGNWVFKILHVNSLWSDQKNEEGREVSDQENGFSSSSSPCSSSDACDCEYDDDDENEIAFDRDSFSKLLKRVSLSDAKLYAQLSYLGNLAYAIPNIKPRNLLKRHGLQYVISSIEKREQLENAEEIHPSAGDGAQVTGPSEKVECDDPRISAAAAFKIAASAASYLNTRTRDIFSSSSDEVNEGVLEEGGSEGGENSRANSEMPSVKATTDSVTSVVSAKEEAKLAVADDLNSTSSWPCEWYICDDQHNATRFFIIQGSETVASWQANLLFEPVQFEELDVFVHRGIYEAAKGMYQQMLPEIHAHMKAHGACAKLRFTGHSLGGSLSLLINLMLLVRADVPVSSLLPVVTFGSPSIMCGGDKLLNQLGLPKSHLQGITIHRDIVPRAFSCSYPSHMVDLLKAVNGNFRSHPCLNSQKHLYAPMGEMLILQPDSKYSPEHELLPSGSGFYILTCSLAEANEAEKYLRAAKFAFLNSPHPLEILSNRSAYGNGGAVQRDHDMNSYLKCIRSLIRHELNQIRKGKREERRKDWWALVSPRVKSGGGVVIGGSRVSPRPSGQLEFLGIVRSGNESLKRFSRLVASQHMHWVVVLMLPARFLLTGVYTV